MKFLILLSLLSSSIFAQTVNQQNNTVTLPDGQVIQAVVVGDAQATQEELNKRMITLEKAVRSLQMEVYNLTEQQMPSLRLFKCTIRVFAQLFSGEGVTAEKAKSEAIKNCETKNHPMHCSRATASCSQIK